LVDQAGHDEQRDRHQAQKHQKIEQHGGQAIGNAHGPQHVGGALSPTPAHLADHRRRDGSPIQPQRHRFEHESNQPGQRQQPDQVIELGKDPGPEISQVNQGTQGDQKKRGSYQTLIGHSWGFRQVSAFLLGQVSGGLWTKAFDLSSLGSRG